MNADLHIQLQILQEIALFLKLEPKSITDIPLLLGYNYKCKNSENFSYI